ncbi:YqaA family protein [Oryzicola mucosus]|uniref:DedA family protein n=1 Tax=Oryzicola mucosus TaxID=2767425 RepID=A0A8J6U4L8_9HYPH|nr:YqaA family protein [Oryzicola mucosus]MBD0414580.1 DedA family protein [Oryzicola mucosus]
MDFAAYFGLFAAALIAASILPGQSEVVVVAMLIADYSPALVLAVATVGNVLGSATSWWLGTQVERFKNKSWFPTDSKNFDRAKAWYHRYGRWSLLLCWVPVAGGPLTLVAGVLREPLWSFMALVSIAKFARYAVVAAVTLNLF